jgi:hypothetical protein
VPDFDGVVLPYLSLFQNQCVDMEDEDDTVNFSALETELHAALEEDAKYWRENDAKFRAVEQGVATFDEFRLPGSLHVHNHVANMEYSFTICTV